MTTSAEMKCLRESMGLTTKWLSKRWGVAEYSVQRWERGRILPDELDADLHDLKRRFDREVQHTAAEADRANEMTGEPTAIIVPRNDVDATRGMPAAWHRAIAQRAAELCGARILYADDEQL